MAQKKPAYEAPSPAEDKKKALATALGQIEKSYGKGAVMRLGDRPELNVDAIPTGSLALDAALGIGGLPRVRPPMPSAASSASEPVGMASTFSSGRSPRRMTAPLP